MSRDRQMMHEQRGERIALSHRPLDARAMPTTPARRSAIMSQILKPRVMSLVVFTGFVGLFLAPGHLHPVLAAVAVLCIAVGAGASGAINMWYDRDIDAVMRRTAGRPLPAGRMLPGEALGFGIVLASARWWSWGWRSTGWPPNCWR